LISKLFIENYASVLGLNQSIIDSSFPFLVIYSCVH